MLCKVNWYIGMRLDRCKVPVSNIHSKDENLKMHKPPQDTWLVFDWFGCVSRIWLLTWKSFKFGKWWPWCHFFPLYFPFLHRGWVSKYGTRSRPNWETSSTQLNRCQSGRMEAVTSQSAKKGFFASTEMYQVFFFVALITSYERSIKCYFLFVDHSIL